MQSNLSNSTLQETPDDVLDQTNLYIILFTLFVTCIICLGCYYDTKWHSIDISDPNSNSGNNPTNNSNPIIYSNTQDLPNNSVSSWI